MCAMEIMKGGGDPNDYIHGLQKVVDNDNEEEEVQRQRLALAHCHSNPGECSRERRGGGHSDTMSLHSHDHDRPTHRSSSRGVNMNSSSHHHRGSRSRQYPPSSHSSSSRHHANQRYTTSSDDRSTHSAGHSIHSAPSTFHFHRGDCSSSRGSFANKGVGGGFIMNHTLFNSSDSSLDTHTTMYSSDSSRRSTSHHSHSSSTSRHSHGGQRRPMRGYHDNINAIPKATTRPQHNSIQQEDEEEEYVCGMPYQGMKYTGQIKSIHAKSQQSQSRVRARVPHGLGTLRSNNGMIWEGTWHFGRLLDGQSQSDHQEDMEEQHSLCEQFDQHTTIQDVHAPVPVSNSDDISVSNYSIAETIHNNDTTTNATTTTTTSSSSKQVMHTTKMDEYSRYITHCDETQDYYYYTEDEEDEDGEDDSDVSSISRYSNSSSSSSLRQYQHGHGPNRHGVRWNENLIENGQRRLGQMHGSRRVRFCEDP